MADADWQGDLAVDKPASNRLRYCIKCQKPQRCTEIDTCYGKDAKVDRKIVCGYCGDTMILKEFSEFTRKG